MEGWFPRFRGEHTRQPIAMRWGCPRTNPQTEQLVEAPPLLRRNYEHELSTRDRPARTGADARIEESVAIGEVCLALLPYGREFKRAFGF